MPVKKNLDYVCSKKELMKIIEKMDMDRFQNRSLEDQTERRGRQLIRKSSTGTTNPMKDRM